MTKVLSIIFLLSFISVNSLASETGRCRLSGKYQGEGIIIAPWKSEKRKFSEISFDRCMEAAKTLLDFESIKLIAVCDLIGACHKREIKITIRKVKYKFTSSDYKIRGKIKKR